MMQTKGNMFLTNDAIPSGIIKTSMHLFAQTCSRGASVEISQGNFKMHSLVLKGASF